MQSLSHRVKELAREAPDPMDIDTKALTIVHQAVPARPSFADTIQMMMISGKLTLSKKKGKGVEKPKKKKKTPAPTRAPTPSPGPMAPPVSSASSVATSATDITDASDRTEHPGEQQTRQSTVAGQGSSFVLPIGRVANLGTTDRPSLPFPETPGRPTAAQEATAALSGERPQTAIGPGLPFAGQGPAQPVPLCTDPAPNIFVQAQAEEWQCLATEQGQQSLAGSATITVTCARCKREGHFSDSCPQPPVCRLCGTTSHEAIDCTTGCKKCGTRRCLELCVDCLVEHSHLYNCPRSLRQRRRCAVCGSRNHLELTDMRCERHPRPQVRVSASGRGEVAPGGAPRQRERTPVVGLANLAPAGGESSAARAAREGGGGGRAPPPNPPRGGQRRGTRSPSPRRNQQGGFRAPDPDPLDSDPGSSSDSDSSPSDSGTEVDNELSRDAEIRKLQHALKALKKRKKSQPQKPSWLDIRPFNGNPDDMQRFVLDIETNFDYHHKALYKDMDKIRLLVPLLEGKAKKWYENIHANINKHVAVRQGIPFDKKSSLWKWDAFFAHLQSSFGQSLTRDKSVLEWNRLHHRNGNIDYFLDRIHALMYATNYTGEMVIDKIKEGLTEEMRRNWALVQNKPTLVTE